MGGFLLLLIMGAFYFLPTIIAAQRRQPNVAAIACVNVFFGWTVIGWILSLVWALAVPNQAVPVIIQNQNTQHVQYPQTMPPPNFVPPQQQVPAQNYMPPQQPMVPPRISPETMPVPTTQPPGYNIDKRDA